MKYYKNGNKKEKIEFLFEFLRTKSKENIPVLENKKFGKGCLKLSEHILYLKCFLSFKYVVGGIIKHSPSNFCPFLNKSGWNVWVSQVTCSLNTVEFSSIILIFLYEFIYTKLQCCIRFDSAVIF